MTYTVGSRYPRPGDRVKIIQKIHYESGELTEGTVDRVLTRSRFHPRGHKVQLTNGIIGRVQEFILPATTMRSDSKTMYAHTEPHASQDSHKETIIYLYTGHAVAPNKLT